MTFTDNTAPSQTDAITFDFELSHPPDKVWRALTDPELVAQWLLPMTGAKLELGAAFTLQAPPQPGWDGLVNGRFLEIEPHRKLSYAWVVGEIDTVVTFTLTATPTGTSLSLVQSGFRAEQKQNFAGARYGWRLFGNKLVELMATKVGGSP